MARRKVVATQLDDGRTKQSMREEVDINILLGRYAKGHMIDHFAKHGGSYGEFSSLTFHEAMNIVRKAEEMFMDLDSSIRKRFGQDPAAFLDFVSNPGNLDEMRKLGLAKAKPEPEAPVAPMVAPGTGVGG